MHDLLTIEEDAAAAAQGWSLQYVWDLDLERLRVMILAVGAPSSEVVGQSVVAQARVGHPLALKALQLINQHNMKAPNV